MRWDRTNEATENWKWDGVARIMSQRIGNGMGSHEKNIRELNMGWQTQRTEHEMAHTENGTWDGKHREWTCRCGDNICK